LFKIAFDMAASRVCLMILVTFVNYACGKQPNFVVILTDDQDVLLDGLKPMVKTNRLLGDHGVTFDNMFVTTPLCCPSRASLLTGRYAHNTNVVNNSVAGGCSGEQWQRGLEAKSSLSVVMKKLNYTTFYAGKYLNKYGKKDAGGVEHVPPGWDWWNGLVGNSRYYNYSLSVNGTEEKHGDKYEDDYLTDVIRKKASKFLSSQFDSNSPDKADPFFMMLSVPAPHAPFLPSPRYNDSFPNVTAQRLPSFGVYGKDKHWLLRQARYPLSNESLLYINETFRHRWQTLLSVDDLVHDVVSKIAFHGELDDTFVIFLSDNGYHLGQFALPNDKRQLYEFDVRVPLIVRGPGVKKKTRSNDLVLNIDIAPTIIDLAGGGVQEHMDGISVRKSLLEDASDEEAATADPVRDSFTIEHSGESGLGIPDHCPQKKEGGVGECKIDCVCEDATNNTYVCIRTINAAKNDVYCKFLDGQSFEEQYNMKTDPYQLVNKAPSLSSRERNIYMRKLFHGILCSGKICQRMNDALVENEYFGSHG